MDILVEVGRSIVTIAFVVAVIAVLAGLFMVVFSIATGFDRKIQR
ncbi:MAG: hypothetical protein ACR2OU_17790 [Thermomicrobiales bacterium]